MKTKILRYKESRDFVVALKPHFWSRWIVSKVRFISKKNAEEYAARWVWKLKHPKRYKRLLEKHSKDYFTGK